MKLHAGDAAADTISSGGARVGARLVEPDEDPGIAARAVRQAQDGGSAEPTQSISSREKT